MTTSTPPVGIVVYVDKCDRCSAKATVLAVLKSGSQLLFCQHHGNEFQPALQMQGAIMYDRSRSH